MIHRQIKSPGCQAPGSENLTQLNHTTAERPLKWRRVLAAMFHGKTFNRFQAERELSDHCLHSTVSVLQGKGVTIERRDEVVPGYCGVATHVTRYWLSPSSIDRARELLGLGPFRSTEGADRTGLV